MSPLVLLLLTTCLPAETQAGAVTNPLPEYPGSQPVGIVTGEHIWGVLYAQTGWPGPPAVRPPHFFARVFGRRPHGPPPLPPDFAPAFHGDAVPPPRMTGSEPLPK